MRIEDMPQATALVIYQEWAKGMSPLEFKVFVSEAWQRYLEVKYGKEKIELAEKAKECHLSVEEYQQGIEELKQDGYYIDGEMSLHSFVTYYPN